MAVYITGDTHADFRRFSTDRFPEQKELSKDDVVIVLGDFGGVWSQSPSPTESYWLNWLSEKPFTLCFCDGNHENFDRLYSEEFDEVDFHGGKAHRIADGVFHLMRGYVFDFDGKKFFCMGGARSHDISDGILNPFANDFRSKYRHYSRENKMFRIEHFSWWCDEIPSKQELAFAEQNLMANDMSVDFVVSHCLPGDIAAAAGFYEKDDLTKWFDSMIERGLNFKEWHCGHYHTTERVLDRFYIHYEDIERIL